MLLSRAMLQISDVQYKVIPDRLNPVPHRIQNLSLQSLFSILQLSGSSKVWKAADLMPLICRNADGISGAWLVKTGSYFGRRFI